MVGAVTDSKNLFARAMLGRGLYKAAIIGGATLSAMLFASLEAQAQNCVIPLRYNRPWCGRGGDSTPVPVTTGGLSLAGATVGASLLATIATANTAFLTQSDAFIGSPPNPPPNSPGGGIWVRTVGGENSVKGSSATSAALTTSLAGSTSGNIPCTSKVHEDYAGVQFGMDIARLNVNAMNFHLGATAGYLEANSHIVGGNVLGGTFNSNIQNPFMGIYAAFTSGGLFATGLVRWQAFQGAFDSPSINMFNQRLSAHGLNATAQSVISTRSPTPAGLSSPLRALSGRALRLIHST
jgi:hypothetical protein